MIGHLLDLRAAPWPAVLGGVQQQVRDRGRAVHSDRAEIRVEKIAGEIGARLQAAPPALAQIMLRGVNLLVLDSQNAALPDQVRASPDWHVLYDTGDAFVAERVTS